MAIFRSVPPSAAGEMAWLASLAYDDGVSLSSLFGTSGWRALGADDLGLPDRFFDAKGFYENRSADGYAAIRDDTFALVFRGSDNFGDLLSSAFDQRDYYDNLRPLINASFDYIADNDVATVEMTGQSLGGAMVMRTAAKNDLGDVADGVSWQLMAFGSPGTDIDNTSSDSRSIVHVTHTGDPVPTDPLLDRLTEHGSTVRIQLPNVENAENLAELARQKEDEGQITEHDVGRYLLSVKAIAGSLEMPGVSPDAVNIMLDQRVLTISGCSRVSVPEGYSLTHHEYREGDCERAFTLSSAIDSDKIEAELKEGVLRLNLPRSQPAPAKTINVKTAE